MTLSTNIALIPLDFIDFVLSVTALIICLAHSDLYGKIASTYLFSRLALSQFQSQISALCESLHMLTTRLRQSISGLFSAQADAPVPDDINMISNVVNSLSVMFSGLLGYSHKPLLKTDIHNINALHAGVTICKDIKGVCQFTFDMLYSAFTSCYTAWTGKPLFVGDKAALITDATVWAQTVDRIREDTKIDNKVHTDQAVANILKELYKEGTILVEKFGKLQVPIVSVPAFNTLYTVVSSLHRTAESMRSIGFGRSAPLYIHIDGPPGRGKSALAQQLFADLSHFKMDIPFSQLLVYSKQFRDTDDYWEGYQNQPFLLMEEIFLLKDEEVRAQAVQAIVRLINIHTESLPMAALNSKGCTFFDSRMAVSTSNSPPNTMPAFSRVLDPGAFTRRLDLWLYVTNSAVKGSAELDLPTFDATTYTISIQDPKNLSNMSTVEVSYVQLLHILSEKWDHNAKAITKNIVRYLTAETFKQKAYRFFGAESQDLTDSQLVDIFSQPDIESVNRAYIATGHSPITPNEKEAPESTPTPDAHFEAPPLKNAKNTNRPKDRIKNLKVQSSIDSLLLAQGKNDTIVNWKSLYNEYCMKKGIAMVKIQTSQTGDPHSPQWRYFLHGAQSTEVFRTKIAAEQRAYRLLLPLDSQGAKDYMYTAYKTIVSVSSKISHSFSSAIQRLTSMDTVQVSEPPQDEKNITLQQRTHSYLTKTITTLEEFGKLHRSGVLHLIVWTGLSICLAIGALLYYLRSHASTVASTLESQSYGTDNRRATRAKPKPHTTIAHRMKPLATQSIRADLSICDQIAKNLYHVGYQGRTPRTLLFFLQDRFAVTTAHSYYDLIEENPERTTIWLSKCGTKEFNTYTLHQDFELVEVEDTDLLFLNFTTTKLPQHTSLIHHIAKEADHKSLYDPATISVLCPREKQNLLLTSTSETVMSEQYDYNNGGDLITVNHALTTNLPTLAGDCGSPWFCIDTRATRGIVGIHAAGNGSMGCATYISREMIEDVLQHFKLTAQGADDTIDRTLVDAALQYCESPILSLGDGVDIPTEVFIVGKMKKEWTPRQAPKSEIVPSLIHGKVIPPVRVPAILGKKYHGGKTPMQRATEKFSLPTETEAAFRIRCPDAAKLVDEAEALLLSILPPGKGKIFTVDEALNGHKDYEYFNKIDKHTSSGWYYSMKKQQEKSTAQGKMFCLHEDETGTLSLKPEVQTEFQSAWDALPTHVRLEDIVVPCSLKDERRETVPTPETEECKICCPHKQYKPRIFNPVGLVWQLCERCVLGEFVNMMMKHHNDLFSACGVKPHSMEWGKLYSDFEFFKHILAGDFKWFDASIHRILTAAFFRVVIAWLKNAGVAQIHLDRVAQMAKARQCQFITILNYICIILKGNPSGSFITTILNGVVVFLSTLVIYCLCLRLQHPEKEITLAMAYAMFKVKDFGDDNLLGMLEKIDPKMFAALMKQVFGMTYTDAGKGGEFTIHHSLNTTTFLRRGFRPDHSVVFAPLDLPTVLDTVNWVTGDRDVAKKTRDNCETAVRELYAHGRQVFEINLLKINRALVAAQLQPIALTYSGLDTLYRSGRYDEEILVPDQRTQIEATRAFLNKPLLDAQSAEDNDRAIAVSTTTEEIQLTSFADHVAKVVDSGPALISPVYGKSDPFPDQELKSQLERTYTRTFPWASTNAFQSVIFTLDLPKDHITGNERLEQVLSKFQWLRSAVEITFRANGTMFHVGSLLIAWIPHYNATTANGGRQTPYELSDIYSASCNNCAYISANSNNPVQILIPYVCPQSYFSLPHLADADQCGSFGYLKVFVMVPLDISSATVVPTINVAVNIAFKGPQVAGPTVYSLPQTALFKRIGKEKEKEKAKYRMITSGTKKITKAQGKEEEGKLSVQSSVDKEQTTTSKDHIVSSTMNVTSDILASLTSVPYIGEVASVAAPALKIGAMIASSFGKDKPNTIETPTQIVVLPYDNISQGKGLDIGQSLSVYPDNKVSNDHSLFCDDQDYTQLINYAKIPTLVTISSIVAPTEGDVFFEAAVSPTFCHQFEDDDGNFNLYPTMMSAVALLFSYWTGGIKYMIVVTCSKFMSGRLRISWIPSPHHKPIDTDDGAGDYVSKIIDINGDQTFTFFVPYLQPTPWSLAIPEFDIDDLDVVNNQHATQNGIIQISAVNDFTYTDTTITPPVTLQIWMAAGEDMRFACPRGLWKNMNWGSFTDPMTAQGIPENDLSFPRRVFMHTFEPLVTPVTVQVTSGIQMGEEIASFLTLGHRYTHRRCATGSWATASTSLDWHYFFPNDYDGSAGEAYDMKYMLESMFLFNRGGTRVLIQRNGSAATLSTCIYARFTQMYGFSDLNGANVDDIYNIDGGDALVMGQLEIRPGFQFTLPFYTNVAMRQSKYQYPLDYLHEMIPGVAIQNSSVTSTNFKMYQAFSDDFSLGWPKTPCRIYYLKPAVAKTTGSPPP